MTAGLLPVPKARFFDNAGAPLSGGKVYTYQAGTTTPLATFTDFGGLTANANPVILDAYGYADIWLVGNYKIILKTSADVQLWSEDNIRSLGTDSPYYADSGGANAYIISPSPASTGYVAGQFYDVKISVANTGASTINVNGLGVKAITYSDGSTLLSGAMPTGAVVRLIYDGAAFQLQNRLGSAASFTSITLSSYLNEAKGADIPSATSTPIGAATGNFIHVTGTTTITSFDTIQAGTRRIVEFTGILTLTHNATTLILPGGANITTAAGDCATFVSEGSGNWRCTNYSKASGLGVIAPAASQINRTTFLVSGTFTTSATITAASKFKMTITGAGGGGAGNTVGTGSSGGGGAGGTSILFASGLTPSTGYTVTVGAAGTGGAAGTNNGVAGGDSIFLISATNVTGSGGAGGTAHGAGGVGGTASNGNINIQGGDGGSGFATNQNIGGGTGGSSYYGGGGSSIPSATAGAGRAYGSGGGGGFNLTSNRAGGDGKAGIVIVEWTE